MFSILCATESRLERKKKSKPLNILDDETLDVTDDETSDQECVYESFSYEKNIRRIHRGTL